MAQTRRRRRKKEEDITQLSIDGVPDELLEKIGRPRLWWYQTKSLNRLEFDISNAIKEYSTTGRSIEYYDFMGDREDMLFLKRYTPTNFTIVDVIRTTLLFFIVGGIIIGSLFGIQKILIALLKRGLIIPRS